MAFLRSPRAFPGGRGGRRGRAARTSAGVPTLRLGGLRPRHPRARCPHQLVVRHVLEGGQGQEVARDGEIVVALIDDSEATLKYFRHEGAMIRLDPANRAYDPQRYAPAQVRVQGRLAGLLRRYS